MKLLYMKLKGFRRYKEQFEIEFDKETYIIGGNSKGKTTIGYAIAWAFLGTDLRGNNKVSLINNDSKDCFVELGFIGNDGINHVIYRYKNKKNSNKNLLLLDGESIKQEDLKHIYKDIPLFLSIFDPNYFKDSETGKQKEIINKYLPDIPFEHIFSLLEKFEQEKVNIPDGDIEKYIKDRKDKLKDIDQKLIRKKGEKEYAQKIIDEPVEDKKVFLKQKEIDLLEQEKDFLLIESKQKDRESLENEIGKKEAELLNIKNKLDKTFENGKKLKLEYNQILSDPLCTCPTCNQPMNSESKEISLKNKRQEMFDLADQRDAYQKEISDLKVEIMTSKMKLFGLGKKEHVLRLQEIDKKLNELEKEKQDIHDFNKTIEIKRKTIEKTKNDIIQIIIDMEKLDEKKEEYNLQKIIGAKLYFLTIQEKIKIAEQYMKNTKIQFCEFVKTTGELKDAFIITNNGEEFRNLSKSQKFVTILEICNMLNKISGLNIPIMIDDSESYPDYDFKFEEYQSQLLIIKAKRNRMLKVTTLEEKITRPKTIKIINNNIQKLKQVA